MTEELWARYTNSRAPFDGATLNCDSYSTVSLLITHLQTIVARLEQRFGSESIMRLLDWHEHDGYISNAEPFRWDELKALVASTERLQEAFRLGDDHVRFGFAPESYRFYLRFIVYFDLPEPGSDYDLTGSDELIESVYASLNGEANILRISKPTSNYFAPTILTNGISFAHRLVGG